MSRPFTPKNLEGATFGRLSVLAPDGLNKSGHLMWRCVCECGNPVRTTGYDLVRGHTRSCGCLRGCKIGEQRRGKGVPVTPGVTFGRLTVLGEAGRDAAGRQMVSLSCACGRTHVARWLNVRAGTTRSCGCGQVIASCRAAPNDTHPWRTSA